MRFEQNIKVVEKDHKVRLSIRVSDNSVDSWIISTEAFRAMGQGWRDTTGITIKDGATELFIQSKRVHSPHGYVRLSICTDAGAIREYRLSLDDLKTLFIHDDIA